MRAAIQNGLCEIAMRDVPAPGRDGALVRVVAAGVCGSDLHEYLQRSEPQSLPDGHEVAGEVVSLPNAYAGPIRIGDLLIDHSLHQVTLSDAVLQLTPTEYRLLTVLAARPGQVVPRDALARLVWGDPDTGTSRTIDVHIGRLRVKLSQAGRSAPQIVSVRGFGYKIVTSTPGAAPASNNQPEATLADGLRS